MPSLVPENDRIIKKIISGGQTGAEQAALDVAIEMGIPHGGWIPKGRRTERGRLPDTYRLRETLTIDYAHQTELNVVDSDGTLILSHGRLTEVSALTQEFTKRHRKTCLHMDLEDVSEYKAVEIINTWITAREIKILNVVGPRASKDPQIYDAVNRILKSVLYPPPDRIPLQLPKTVDEAVDQLISVLSLQEKNRIARMGKDALPFLYPPFSRYIREKFKLGSGNEGLKQSCRFLSGSYDLQDNEASALIISELWKRLRESHLLRVVKND